MSLCVIDGKQCQCQPDEGSYCPRAVARTCGTCKHFGPELEVWDGDKDDLVLSGYHTCQLINLKRAEQKVPPPLAYAQDGSDYRACLIVRSDFGCVEWAAQGKGSEP